MCILVWQKSTFVFLFFFFKQKTAYDMRISDWSSDVCSSDLSELLVNKKGWYIDLATPERVISAPTISGTAMLLSSVIPATGSDCASAAGSGFLNAINLFTGTSPESGGYLGNGGTVTDADEIGRAHV